MRREKTGGSKKAGNKKSTLPLQNTPWIELTIVYFVSSNSSLPFDTYTHFKEGEAEAQNSKVTLPMFP